VSELTVSCEAQLNDEKECQNGMDDGDDSHRHDDDIIECSGSGGLCW
jgi:hypothetical protein